MVRLYVEGGGDRIELRKKCRDGFGSFLVKAGMKGIIVCVVRGDRTASRMGLGGRQEATREMICVNPKENGTCSRFETGANLRDSGWIDRWNFASCLKSERRFHRTRSRERNVLFRMSRFHGDGPDSRHVFTIF